MAKKIILFLSELRPDAPVQDFACPEGPAIAGRQTNEAPVKYLLRTHPDISEILCIVTPRALATAWRPFSSSVLLEAPQVWLLQIPFPDGTEFAAGPLVDVMRHTSPGDEIFLETTGGLRSAIMDLLLLSRILTYKGIRTAGAVYGNLAQRRIQDASHLMALFDLVGGMQELTSFGSTRTLRAYYGQPADDPYVESLLAAAEELTEAITLCRVQEIGAATEAFDGALSAAERCRDPLMRQLLPVFRAKFGGTGGPLSAPDLIRWCLQSGLVQQALTVYTERIPAHLLRSGRYLLATDAVRRPLVHSYEDPDAAQFSRDFLTLSKRARLVDLADNSVHSYVETLRNLESLLPASGYRPLCPVEGLRTLCMDYLYIKMLRNMTNHAQSEETEGQRELLEYLASFGYEPIGRISSASIRRALLEGLEHLDTCAGPAGEEQTP